MYLFIFSFGKRFSSFWEEKKKNSGQFNELFQNKFGKLLKRYIPWLVMKLFSKAIIIMMKHY